MPKTRKRSVFAADSHARANYAGGSANLEARATLWSYVVRDDAEPPGRLDWFCDLVEWDGARLAVDVGTGSGRFLPALEARAERVVGLDFSQAMLAEVATESPTIPLLRGDVCRLPLRDGAADVVLAAWMLYHAADVDLACAELRRVVADDGVLIAVTNAAGHTAELDDLFAEAFVSLTGAPPSVGLPGNAFTLDEAAASLARHFRSISMHPRRIRVRVPTVEPLVAYLGSLRSYIDDALRARGETFEDLVPHIEAAAAPRIQRFGAMEVTGLPTAVVCRGVSATHR